MHAHVFVKGDSNDGHATCGHVPDERDAGQCARGVNLVAVDDVLVAADEDAQDT